MTAQQVEKQICKDYVNNIGLDKIARKYHKSTYKIKDILSKNGIRLRQMGEWFRKYTYDKSFFKKIDTEEKAYWLGFLYADGCIAKYSVNLLLHQDDVQVIKDFKKSLKYTGPIEFRSDKIDYGSKYGIKDSKTVKVRITGRELREDLAKLGCVPRKTFILAFPTKSQVPKKLIRHFIRGYFDGDGSVYERKYVRKDGKKRGFARITSTDNMVQKIKEIFIDCYKIPASSIHIRRHPNSNGISIMQFCSFRSMKLLKGYLYNKASIFLKRKRDKFYSLYLESN